MLVRTPSYFRDKNHLPGQIWTLLFLAALAACSGASPAESIPADPDLALAQAVRAALDDAGLPTDALQIDTRAGEVTLSGTAPTLDDVRRILRTAGGVKGVAALVNRIRVVEAA